MKFFVINWSNVQSLYHHCSFSNRMKTYKMKLYIQHCIQNINSYLTNNPGICYTLNKICVRSFQSFSWFQYMYIYVYILYYTYIILYIYLKHYKHINPCTNTRVHTHTQYTFSSLIYIIAIKHTKEIFVRFIVFIGKNEIKII